MIPLLLCIFLLYFQCVFSLLLTVTESISYQKTLKCVPDEYPMNLLIQRIQSMH